MSRPSRSFPSRICSWNAKPSPGIDRSELWKCSLRPLLLVGLLFTCSYAVLRLNDRFNGGASDSATPRTPPPGVADLLNPGILIEGRAFISGSDDWDTIVAPGSPSSTEKTAVRHTENTGGEHMDPP